VQEKHLRRVGDNSLFEYKTKKIAYLRRVDNNSLFKYKTKKGRPCKRCLQGSIKTSLTLLTKTSKMRKNICLCQQFQYLPMVDIERMLLTTFKRLNLVHTLSHMTQCRYMPHSYYQLNIFMFPINYVLINSLYVERSELCSVNK